MNISLDSLLQEVTAEETCKYWRYFALTSLETTLFGADILTGDNFWLELICCKTTTTRVFCLSLFLNVYPHFSSNISLGLFLLRLSISSFPPSVSLLIKKSYDPSIIFSNPDTDLSVGWSVEWCYWKFSKTLEIVYVKDICLDHDFEAPIFVSLVSSNSLLIVFTI